MGYDIGFHAIDVKDIDSACAFIMGKVQSLPYLESALISAKSRFTANALGLGVSELDSKAFSAQMSIIDADAEKNTPNFFVKLLGKKAIKPDYSNIDTSTSVGNFDSDLHLWGRPFLIVNNGNIENIINQYLSATITESEKIAKSQIEALLQGLSKKVTPDKAELPSDAIFIHNIRWKIDLMRKAFQAYGSRNTVQDDEGNNPQPFRLIHW